MVAGDQRRVHTELDHHSIPPQTYIVSPNKRFKEKRGSNRNEEKISMKIKKTRKERELEDRHMPTMNQQQYEEELIEANNYPQDIDEQEMYKMDQLYPEDLQEGKYLMFNQASEYDESKDEYEDQMFQRDLPTPSPFENASYDLEDNSFNQEGLYQSSDSYDDIFDDKIYDMDEDDYVTVKYAKDYIRKMEEDIKSLHNRHVRLMKEMEESYKHLEKDNEDKQLKNEENLQRIKNYRVAIKELIKQTEELNQEKEEAVKNLKEHIENLEKEKAEFTEQYHQDQENWENEHLEEVEAMKEDFEEMMRVKDNEHQRSIISYEGQIEDLNRELSSLHTEKVNLLKKCQQEIEQVNQRDIDISVKSCVENMLYILELKEINTKCQEKIKLLKQQNEELKQKRSVSSKKNISKKNIFKPSKLNISGLSLASQNAKTNPTGVNKTVIAPSGGRKLKIGRNKIKIKNNNMSVMEENKTSTLREKSDTKLDDKLNTIVAEIKGLKRQKENLKSELKLYGDKYAEEHDSSYPNRDNDAKCRQFLNAITEISNTIKQKEKEFENSKAELQSQLKSRSVSPGSHAFKNFNTNRNLTSSNEAPENAYGRDIEADTLKKELSPFRSGENSSFFSNANEISNINFTTNKSNDNIDQQLQDDIKAIGNEEDVNIKVERARNLRMKVTTSNNNKETSVSESSQNSTQNMYKVREGMQHYLIFILL